MYGPGRAVHTILQSGKTFMMLTTELLLLTIFGLASGIHYQPNWESLDARPLPAWYDEAKFGIFLHWGLYSVPGYKGAWLWYWWKGPNPQPDVVEYFKKNYPPDFEYADFAPDFKATFYDPNQWADIFKASGAKYVVLTSKHHEGWTNFPSKYSWNWNSVDDGPHRDLTGDLAQAIRNRTDMHFGLYYSLFEFFNPRYLADKANKFRTQDYVQNKPMPELQYIVNAYKPDVIWSDGDWEAPSTYWNSTQFLAWLYNDSPVKDSVVTNDRWGSGCYCKHGGYYNCHDRYNPGVLQKHKWENAMTMDRTSWAHRNNINFEDILSMDELLQTMAETISCGGNLLLNVGPTDDGMIIPAFEERLRQIGAWLKVNGEAIYASKPWKHQNDTLTQGVWYTSKLSATVGTVVYAIVLDWPAGTTLTLGAPTATPQTTVSMLGYSTPFKWTQGPQGGIVINIPPISANKLPCQWAWVFKLLHIS